MQATSSVWHRSSWSGAFCSWCSGAFLCRAVLGNTDTIGAMPSRTPQRCRFPMPAIKSARAATPTPSKRKARVCISELPARRVMGGLRHTPMILPRCSRQSWTPPCFASVVTRQTWPSQRTFPRSSPPSTRAALLATLAISHTVPPSSRLREAANEYHSPSTAHSVACCRGCLEEHPGGNTRGFTQLQHDGALVGNVGGHHQVHRLRQLRSGLSDGEPGS